MSEKIAIIGIGRVGLPLALYLAQKGWHVNGIDVNEDYVAGVKAARMPFVEKGAEPVLKEQVGKNFFPTTDISVARDSKYIILTIGTPVDEHMNPEHGQIESVISDLCPHLGQDHLLILRSTVSPGTTEYIARYINENTKFTVGVDIFLAFCPERIAEGNSLDELEGIPQIIGGAEEQSTSMAADFFSQVCTTVLPTDARSAELAKLYCNMYRYIDFAIANEFMMLSEQYDRKIHDIVSLVNTGYSRGGLKSPGFTGGPCLYKDGFFLLSKTTFTELIYTSCKISESVPTFLLQTVSEHIASYVPALNQAGNRLTYAILGLAFKKNVDDSRNSLSYKLKKLIRQEGHEVLLHDPFLAPDGLKETVMAADVIIIAVNHDDYLRDLAKIADWAKPDSVFCDIWNLAGTGNICFGAALAKKLEGKEAISASKS